MVVQNVRLQSQLEIGDQRFFIEKTRSTTPTYSLEMTLQSSPFVTWVAVPSISPIPEMQKGVFKVKWTVTPILVVRTSILTRSSSLRGLQRECIDFSKDRRAIQRVREARIKLSSTAQIEINLPFITTDASGPKPINTKLSQSPFEGLVNTLVERPSKKAWTDADVSTHEINGFILISAEVIETVKSTFERIV